MKEVPDEALKRVQDVFLLYKAHLAVHLGELGLAVGAQVLVPEALYDLVVFVDAADHEQLLEGLRALRQGVELTGVHAAGHHEVAGAFRRGLDENGRFDVDEIDAVQILPGLDVDAVAEQEVALNRTTAQVEVTVLHPQIVPTVGVVFDGKRRRVSRIEDGQAGDFDFDFTGWNLLVFGFAFTHGAYSLDHKLPTEFARLQAQVGVGVHVKGELRNAVAVAEVDKGHAAEVAGALDPTAQGDGLADVVGAKFAAVM